MSLHEISFFSPALAKAPCEKITINDFVIGLKFGKWKDIVERVRNEPNAELRKKLKLGVPGVTVSGTFTERKQENLIKHSEFICCDIDGFTDRTALVADPYTYALFSSISNSGLGVLVKINPAKHKESFRWLQNYYYASYGISIDPAPSNPASLRFISYDPNTFINEQSITSKTATTKPPKIHSLPIILPQDKVSEMVDELVSKGINIAEDYNSYVNLGFSLVAGFGEEGRAYFHKICALSSKYNSAHCDKQYDICLKHRPQNGREISVGTFYWMLKDAGIEFPKNPKYENAVMAAAMMKKSDSLTKSGIIDTLVEIKSIPRVDAEKIVEEVIRRGDISIKTIATDSEKLIESTVEWMQTNHPLRKNIITGKIEEKGVEITKEYINTIYLRARSALNTPLVSFDLIERIIFSNYTPEFHPIKEYIEKNRNRNTTGNIDRLIKTIKTPTVGADDFIRKWFLSLPAAVAGNPVRLVLALTGVQLSGKTEYYRRLLPKDLKKYYGESKMDAGKDDELLMCQKLILMDDEMGGKSRQDERRFKDLTSKSTFSLRAPYGRYNEDYKRLAVLCGTSNDDEVINDPTGNTRILPVKVLSIDHEAYNSIDKDELFMEAVRLYEAGETFNFTKDELNNLKNVTPDFEAIQFERELLLKYFIPVSDRKDQRGVVDNMTATDIKNYLETHTKQQIRSMKRFGIELKNIFGNSKTYRIGDKTIKMYEVFKIDGDSQAEAAFSFGDDSMRPMSGEELPF